MVRARFRVDGAGVCLQSPQGDFLAVWGRCAGRDGGERTRQEALADRLSRVCGDVRLGGWRVSCRQVVRLGVESLAAVPGRD